MGYRTEHGDEETTSLEKSSLPTTDVLIKENKSSGLSFNPPGPLLDHSVSAESSVCLPKSNAAENVEPHAVKLSESAAACQASSECDTSKHLFDQSVSTKFASSFKAGEAASHNHAISLQNTLQNSGKVDDACNNELCIVDDMENNFHIAAADKCGERLMTSADKSLDSGHLNIGQRNPSSNSQEPDVALNNCSIVKDEHYDQILTSTDEDTGFPMEHAEGFDDPNRRSHVELSGNLQKTHLQQNEQLLPSAEEGTVPPMEVDHAVHSDVLIEEMPLTRDSDTNGAALGFVQQWSEIDMLKVGCSLPGSLNHPLATGDISESIGIIRVDNDSHKPQSLGPHFQSKPLSPGVSLTTPDLGTQEEPGQSLASALKELHKLLIVNSKEDSRRPLTEAESCGQSDLGIVVRAEKIEGPEKDIDKKILINSDMQPGELENSALETQLEAPPYFTHTPGRTCINGFEHSTPASMDITQEIQEVAQRDVAIIPDSAEISIAQTDFSPLVELSETAEAGNNISESNRHATSTQTTFSDVHLHSASSTEAMLPEMVQDLPQQEAARPLKGEGEVSNQLVGDAVTSAEVPSPQFPATAVQQILGAGFSLQEAITALEHAGGNADLALLVLLARNIVVPS